ncbi:MAG: FIVAR domain-containing protein [Clostridia bacterium]|nr:FIVAR domain-containing protein [Clostridia bacterium]
MQLKKRILFLFLAVLMAANLVLPAYAAVVAGKTEGAAEEIITVSYQYTDIAGISGAFTYSNRAMFSDVKFYIEGLTTGQYNPANGRLAFFGYEPVDCTITLVLTIAADVAAGDSCTITLEYEATSDGVLPEVPDYKYDDVIIKVVEKLDFSILRRLIEEASALDATKYTAKSWQVLEDALRAAQEALNSTTQEEINAAVDLLRDAIAALERLPEPPPIDYAELLKQIKLAEDLDEADYTPESFAVLKEALANAKSKRHSLDQAEVDAAAAALKAAIAQLVWIRTPGEVDYTELDRQILIARSLNEGEYSPESWAAMMTALDIAQAARSSKDQNVVDKAATGLKEAIASLVRIKPPVDFTELREQIAIAESLEREPYTTLSWTQMQDALENARQALNSSEQSEVDAAANRLRNAIADLVILDLQRLLDAMAAVEAHARNEALSELWYRLHQLLNEAELAILEEDQAKIDACANEIELVLAEIERLLAEMKEPQTVIIERPIPSEPDGDYCNIEGHPFWQILFWISLALNISAGGFIGIYFFLKRKKTTDDTPLVDYDITDDE